MVRTVFVVALSLSCGFAWATLVDLVDPMIGTVTYPESGLRGDEVIHGFGKTFPGATTPFGAVQLSPDTASSFAAKSLP